MGNKLPRKPAGLSNSGPTQDLDRKARVGKDGSRPGRAAPHQETIEGFPEPTEVEIYGAHPDDD